MKRTFMFWVLILGLTLSWTLACAADFYVVSTKKKNYAPPAKTGQTTSLLPFDDGALQEGIGWPIPRFKINGNGTITDNLTGLIWTRVANCFGQIRWDQALLSCASLESGICDLADGSVVGDWRLPNRRELDSLVDLGQGDPALPSGHPFYNVQSAYYWSSTSYLGASPSHAWYVTFYDGNVQLYEKSLELWVWCVRGGE